MRIVIFDTETTGFPLSNAPLSDQPYVCQFAGVLLECDTKAKTMKELGRLDRIVKPEILIPLESTNVHGITNDMVADAPVFGDVVKDVLELFQSADVAVAHNISFDQQIIGIELQRLQLPTKFLPEQIFDTMKETRDVCQLPGKKGNFKYPTLTELYVHLYGRGFENAHNAMGDVVATAQCLYKLLQSGVFLPEEPQQTSLF